MPTLYIVRGLPGSGKSTLAEKIAEAKGIFHVESDMYFMHWGEYKFDQKLLPEAHAWCFDKTQHELDHNRSVVVSNTFVKPWEMERYINYALAVKAEIEIIECDGDYGNVHNVPQEVLDRMKRMWTPNEKLKVPSNVILRNVKDVFVQGRN